MDGGGAGKGGLGGPSWDIWELGNWGAAPAAASSSADAPSYTASPSGYAVASSSAYNSTACSPFPDRPVVPAGGGDHYQFLSHGHQQHHQQQQLTCLKLGKRPYYEAEGPGVGAPVARRPVAGSSSTSGVVPRCQVEGCGKPLGDAKEYHRRHKVCDAHSKAPRVIVLGAEQRFCQQCSRFHVISEFDDSKRSCRRRLAGHNERRRKSTNDSILRNNSLENTMISSKFPFITSTSPGRALSLLSSKSSPWVSTSDLSSRSSAALRELIAENRAALLAHQLFSDRSCYVTSPMAQAVLPCVTHQNDTASQAPTQLSDEWNQTQVTLDLLQMPNTSLEILPGRSKTGNEDEHCCDIWKSLEGAHMV